MILVLGVLLAQAGSGQDLALRIDQPEQIALPAVVDAEYALTWLGVR